MPVGSTGMPVDTGAVPVETDGKLEAGAAFADGRDVDFSTTRVAALPSPAVDVVVVAVVTVDDACLETAVRVFFFFLAWALTALASNKSSPNEPGPSDNSFFATGTGPLTFDVTLEAVTDVDAPFPLTGINPGARSLAEPRRADVVVTTGALPGSSEDARWCRGDIDPAPADSGCVNTRSPRSLELDSSVVGLSALDISVNSFSMSAQAP